MNTVRAKTIGGADSIELRKFLTADIHPAIKAYFKNEVERMLQQERLLELRSKKFSYSLPETVSLQKQIDLVLINRYEFDQTEFEALLDQAVHFHFNYLCRPQWTLQNFVFERKRKIKSNELLRKMRYCVAYSYFPKIIQRYLNTKGLAEVTYEEFKMLIKKVDDAVTGDYSAKELASLMRTMLSFVVAGIPHSSNLLTGPSIPINAAIVFFEDKNRLDIMSRLEFERDENEVSQLSIDQLSGIIQSVLGIEELEAEQEVTKLVDHAENLSDSAVEKITPTLIPQPYPPPIATQEKKTPEPELVSEKTSQSPRKKKKERIHHVSIKFTKTEQKAFVKKLFGKNEEDFHQAIDLLSRTREWNDASLIMDQIFVQNNIDPFSKEAILFTDRIYESFHPEADSRNGGVLNQ